jgi:hypothetical protein
METINGVKLSSMAMGIALIIAKYYINVWGNLYISQPIGCFRCFSIDSLKISQHNFLLSPKFEAWSAK